MPQDSRSERPFRSRGRSPSRRNRAVVPQLLQAAIGNTGSARSDLPFQHVDAPPGLDHMASAMQKICQAMQQCAAALAHQQLERARIGFDDLPAELKY